MAWWSWIVIWGVLVILTLGMLAWQGYRLFRKFLATLEALGDLADRVSDLGANVEALQPERRVPAIFANPHVLQAARQQHRAIRAHERQARRDRLIRQGKLLQRAPLSQRTPPNA
jgi:hypothetical protein